MKDTSCCATDYRRKYMACMAFSNSSGERKRRRRLHRTLLNMYVQCTTQQCIECIRSAYALLFDLCDFISFDCAV